MQDISNIYGEGYQQMNMKQNFYTTKLAEITEFYAVYIC